MNRSTVAVLIFGTLWAGSLSLEAHAQVQTLQTTVKPLPANPLNLPSPVPPILPESKPANSGGSAPNINSNLHHNLFNTGNTPAGVPRTSVGQERILQIDPGIFSDLPDAVRHGAEARQVQAGLDALREASNVLPAGSQRNPGLPDVPGKQNSGQTEGLDPLADLREETNSRNNRRNSNPSPGLRDYNNPRGGLGLVMYGQGGTVKRTETRQDGTTVRTETTQDGTAVSTTTTQDGYKITEWSGRGNFGTTVVAPDGRTFTIESRDLGDGTYENQGTFHDPNTGRTERSASYQTDDVPDDSRAWFFLTLDRRRGGTTRDCAPDAPCGPSAEEAGLATPAIIRTPKSVVERLQEERRPGAQVRPDESTPPAAVPRLTVDPLVPVVNPGLESRTTGGNPDPSRFDRSPDQVNPGCRPNGC